MWLYYLKEAQNWLYLVDGSEFFNSKIGAKAHEKAQWPSPPFQDLRRRILGRSLCIKWSQNFDWGSHQT